MWLLYTYYKWLQHPSFKVIYLRLTRTSIDRLTDCKATNERAHWRNEARARTHHPKIKHAMDVICQTLAFMLLSILVRSILFDFFSFHFGPFHSVTFFLLCQHYYCIHIRIVFYVNERTSFIINKMLIFFLLLLSLEFLFLFCPILLESPFPFSLSVALGHSNLHRSCMVWAAQNYTPIYLFGLFSPFSCYSYFIVDEIFWLRNGSAASNDRLSCLLFIWYEFIYS